jgi:hypothetical protein
MAENALNEWAVRLANDIHNGQWSTVMTAIEQTESPTRAALLAVMITDQLNAHQRAQLITRLENQLFDGEM